MKTVKKQPATMKDLSTLATIEKPFTIANGETASGKPCLIIVTDKRTSLEDYKELMNNIRLAGGFGFLKYHAELKGRYISAVKIDAETLNQLASAYEWTAAEPKTKKPAKAIKTKTDKTAKQAATADIASEIDPEQFKQFLAFQAMLKANK